MLDEALWYIQNVTGEVFSLCEVVGADTDYECQLADGIGGDVWISGYDLVADADLQSGLEGEPVKGRAVWEDGENID